MVIAVCVHHYYEVLTMFAGINIIQFFYVLVRNQALENLKIANTTNMVMASVTKLNLYLIMIMVCKGAGGDGGNVSS